MVTIELIIETACKTLEINKDELLSDSMKKPLPDARKIISSLCREYCTVKLERKCDPKGRYYASCDKKATRKPTYKQIAKALNKKNHVTASVQEIECKQLLKIDSVFRERYNSVLEALNWHLGKGISQFEKPENRKQ